MIQQSSQAPSTTESPSCPKQLKESKKAAVEEEKAYAKSMQKVDEDMRAEIQELQARIAAEQAKIDKTRAERLVRPSDKTCSFHQPLEACGLPPNE